MKLPHDAHHASVIIALQLQKKRLGLTHLTTPQVLNSPPCCHGVHTCSASPVHPWQWSPLWQLSSPDYPSPFSFVIPSVMSNMLGCSPARQLLDKMPAPIPFEFHWILPAALIGFRRNCKHLSLRQGGSSRVQLWWTTIRQYLLTLVNKPSSLALDFLLDN
jgi:hypothetical protein